MDDDAERIPEARRPVLEQPPAVNRSAERHARGSPGKAVLIWAVWVASLGLAVLGLLESRLGGPTDPLSDLESLMVVLSTVTVGAVLVTRLPGNIVGWLLLAGGASFAVSTGFGALADIGLNLRPGSVTGAVWFAVLGPAVGAPGAGLLLGFVPFFFPTGHLPSSRWWVVIPIGAVATLMPAVVSLLSPLEPGTYPAGVANPLAPSGLDDVVRSLSALGNALGLVALLLVIASLVARYRWAGGIERQQIRWFAFVGVVAMSALCVASVIQGDAGGAAATINSISWLVAVTGVILLPVAIGMAIFRYRLYEIDRLISRTIGWAIVSGVLVAVLAAAILVFQAVLAPLTGRNTLAVAASTLVVVALFQPLRRVVQSRVDRRFNRSRYDAERVVDGFAGRLRDEVDLDQLVIDITAAVGRSVQPASVSLWLRR